MQQLCVGINCAPLCTFRFSAKGWDRHWFLVWHRFLRVTECSSLSLAASASCLRSLDIHPLMLLHRTIRTTKEGIASTSLFNYAATNISMCGSSLDMFVSSYLVGSVPDYHNTSWQTSPCSHEHSKADTFKLLDYVQETQRLTAFARHSCSQWGTNLVSEKWYLPTNPSYGRGNTPSLAEAFM